jgi:hypothetical protein
MMHWDANKCKCVVRGGNAMVIKVPAGRRGGCSLCGKGGMYGSTGGMHSSAPIGMKHGGQMSMMHKLLVLKKMQAMKNGKE